MVTCRLTACTPGSAPGPTLGVEYGKPLPFYLFICLAKQFEHWVAENAGHENVGKEVEACNLKSDTGVENCRSRIVQVHR